jgi:hypothetical protein
VKARVVPAAALILAIRMYVPAAFEETDPETLFSLMGRPPVALLVSDIRGVPFASHLPLLLMQRSRRRDEPTGIRTFEKESNRMIDEAVDCERPGRLNDMRDAAGVEDGLLLGARLAERDTVLAAGVGADDDTAWSRGGAGPGW